MQSAFCFRVPILLCYQFKFRSRAFRSCSQRAAPNHVLVTAREKIVFLEKGAPRRRRSPDAHGTGTALTISKTGRIFTEQSHALCFVHSSFSEPPDHPPPLTDAELDEAWGDGSPATQPFAAFARIAALHSSCCFFIMSKLSH